MPNNTPESPAFMQSTKPDRFPANKAFGQALRQAIDTANDLDEATLNVATVLASHFATAEGKDEARAAQAQMHGYAYELPPSILLQETKGPTQ